MEGGFGKSLFGYRKEDVERSISQLEVENMKKIAALEEELNLVKGKLRASENTCAELKAQIEEMVKKQSALVDLLAAAKDKAKSIEHDAQSRAHQMLSDAEEEVVQRRQEVESLRMNYKDFQQDMMGLLGRYAQMLDRLPDMVFIDEDKALPPGNNSLFQRRADSLLKSTSEWSDRPFPPAESRALARPEPRVFSGDQNRSLLNNEDRTSPFSSPAFTGEIAEADFIPGGTASFGGELPESNQPAGSMNQLSYEPTVEEPWAVKTVNEVFGDRSAEFDLLKVSTEESVSNLPPVGENPAWAAFPDREPYTPFSSSISENPEPESPLAIKPFSLFGPPGESLLGNNTEPADTVLDGQPFAAYPEKSLQASRHVELEPEKAFNPIQPAPDAFKEEPRLEKSLAASRSNGNGSSNGNGNGLIGGGADTVLTNGTNHGLPNAGPPVPENQALQPVARPRLPFDAQPKPEKSDDKMAMLPFRPWSNDSKEQEEVRQPFAEGASLKDLLARHREEMERKARMEEMPPDNTLRLDISEEDRKFWS